MKPGPISVLDQIFFFPEVKLISHVFPLLEGEGEKLENKSRSSKKILKNLIFVKKFDFRGPFMSIGPILK